jgi:hypothetical protein
MRWLILLALGMCLALSAQDGERVTLAQALSRLVAAQELCTMC